jgi:hypothetical protein
MREAVGRRRVVKVVRMEANYPDNVNELLLLLSVFCMAPRYPPSGYLIVAR